MLERQRLAVHPDGDQRLALLVEQDRQRGARGEVVGAGGADRVGAVLDAGLAEEVADRDPDPGGVADVLAADRVRDAGQRDPPLHQAPREQVLVGELELAVDHAVDAQHEAVDRHVGHLEAVSTR